MKPPRKRSNGFFHQHSLSIVAIAILITWVCLYIFFSPETHLGSFFGNAIADWTGVVVTVLATKVLYEKDSAESNQPPRGAFGPIQRRLENHSLSIFLLITGIGWFALYGFIDSESKWGQVVGNIASEWLQMLGLVLLTKGLIEKHSKENKNK